MAKRRVYSVNWSDTAAADLRAIIENVARDSVSAAAAVFEGIAAHASRLRSFPSRGRIIAELESQGIRSYRELIATPWRIIYKIEAREVRVLAVLDARRNLEDLLLERFLR